jgi:phosphomannomutase
VQRALFEGDVDRVALVDPRGRAEAPDERGPLVRRELLITRSSPTSSASSRTSSVTAARAETEKCIKTSEPSASRSLA